MTEITITVSIVFIQNSDVDSKRIIKFLERLQKTMFYYKRVRLCSSSGTCAFGERAD